MTLFPARRRAAALLACVAVLASGCSDSATPSPSAALGSAGPTATATASSRPRPTTTATAPTATPSPTALPTAVPTIAPTAPLTAVPTPTPSPTSSAAAACATQTLASLTEAQRVGQLFLLGLTDNRFGPAQLSAIRDQHFGSVWFTVRTSVGVAGIRQIADAVQAQATMANTGGVRFFIAANQEGGLVQALKGTGFSTIPSAVDQGMLDPTTLQRHAATWGRQLRAAGVNLNFAPVFDVVPADNVATNQPIGVLKREYGNDAATVATHASAFVLGMASSGIATTAKHFPGLGQVTGNTDFTSDVVDTVTTDDDPTLASFQAGIAAGVPFVMVATATYEQIDPDHLAAFSPIVVTQLLRGQLGFRGVVVSDDIGNAAAVASIPAADRGIEFLEAGGDLIISAKIPPATAMAEAILARAATDSAFHARVDDAALRILMAKAASGLLPCS